MFLSLEIAQLLFVNGTGCFRWLKLQGADVNFLKEFQIERIERVRKVIDGAKDKSRKIPHKYAHISLDDWDNYVISCPICGNDAILDGYTEISGDANEDGDVSPVLDFFANSFRCESCGLQLEDVEKLKLASIDTVYDRNDELDKWFSEMGDGYEY